jgi:hypothetical protein
MNVRHLATNTIAATGIGVLAVVVGGLGVATAANGGSLTLGHHNSATKTTTLTDKKGTPLSLVTKKGKPPLKVNSKGLVKHLNASLLGGKSAAQLQAIASAAAGELVINGSTPIKTITLPVGTAGPDGPALSPVLIASTATLDPGTYIVNAQAISGDALCWVDTAPNPDKPHEFGGGAHNGSSAVVDTAFTLTSAHKLNLYCSNLENTPGSVLTAGITAIKVASVATGHSTAGTLSDAVKHRR